MDLTKALKSCGIVIVFDHFIDSSAFRETPSLYDIHVSINCN